MSYLSVFKTELLKIYLHHVLFSQTLMKTLKKKKKQNNVVSYFYREMLFLLSLFHFFSHQSKEKNDNFLLKINNYVSLLNI